MIYKMIYLKTGTIRTTADFEQVCKHLEKAREDIDVFDPQKRNIGGSWIKREGRRKLRVWTIEKPDRTPHNQSTLGG